MVYGPGSRPVSKVLDFIEKGCGPHTLELMLDPANWESGRQQGPTDVSLWPLPLFPSSDRPPHGIIVWRSTLKQSGGQSVTRSVCLKQCQSVIPYLDTESFMGVAHTPFFPSCVPILDIRVWSRFLESHGVAGHAYVRVCGNFSCVGTITGTTHCSLLTAVHSLG